MIAGLLFAATLSVTPNAVTATIGAPRPGYAFIKLVGEGSITIHEADCRGIAHVRRGQGVGVNNSTRLELLITGIAPGHCSVRVTSGELSASVSVTVPPR